MSFTSLKTLIEDANNLKTPIYQVMINNEMELRGISESELLAAMGEQFDVMLESVRKGTQELTMSKPVLPEGTATEFINMLKKENRSLIPSP